MCLYTMHIYASPHSSYLSPKTHLAVCLPRLKCCGGSHTVYTSLWNGGRVGIVTPKLRDGSLTDQIFLDLQLVRPTVLKGVPTFWERLVNAGSQFLPGVKRCGLQSDCRKPDGPR